jgi:hypothetical protein
MNINPYRPILLGFSIDLIGITDWFLMVFNSSGSMEIKGSELV